MDEVVHSQNHHLAAQSKALLRAGYVQLVSLDGPGNDLAIDAWAHPTDVVNVSGHQLRRGLFTTQKNHPCDVTTKPVVVKWVSSWSRKHFR